ncbi:hypothetical protein [Pseudomonas extremaustralis]|uniref:hypothetical protein n=1 Tax=Pseudomonas extremaustralis TaxID=359110 RepID=UPI00123902EF|nr:hypothetical protein [Pseudomonas extremaustralis]
MSIDWSEAPSWATAVGKHSVSLAWLCDSGYCFHGIANPPCHPYKENSYSADMFTIVERRPWTGEGLPPVGTVCEYQTWVNREWKQTKVLAHHLGFAVHSWSVDGDDMEVDAAPPQDFRPIRTPEQIAAHERESGIKQLIEDTRICNPGVMWRQMAETIYDAGYRKKVAP